jgi:hypothetical protein
MAKDKIRYISYRDVRKKGRKDGKEWKFRFGWPLREPKEPTPSLSQKEPCSYELELAGIADQDLKLIKVEWAEMDKMLLRDYCGSKKELAGITESLKKENEEHRAALKEYETARKEFESMPGPHLLPKVYWFLMALFFICEFPINALVMSVMGRGLIETYIMAGAICGGILWMSHLVGSSFKKLIKNWTVIIIGLSVTAGLLVGISILREKFFEAQQSQQIIGIKISSTTITFVFILVNAFIFVFASWSSYESSQSDPDKYSVARKRLKSATSDVNKEGSEAVEAKNKLEATLGKFNSASTMRQKAFDKKNSEAEALTSTFEALVHGYRDANLNARKSSAMPESFKIDPKDHIKVEGELLSISWDCPNGTPIPAKAS